MARKKSRADHTAAATSARIDSEAAIRAILAIAAIVVPLMVSVTGLDVFRLPKELAFRATAILVMVAGVFAATERGATWKWLRHWRYETALVLLIITWTGLTTLTSTNRALSYQSFITVICAAAIFVAARLTAPRTPILVFDLILIGACINAVLVTLQEYKTWNPFFFSELVERHSRSTALIGNPNDVGAYLVGPALAVIVGAAVAPGWRRWIYAALGAILAMGLIASGTRTALIAYVGGLVAFSFRRSWRGAAAVLACATIVSALVIAPQTSVGRTVKRLWTAAAEKRYDILFSERLPPFLSALEMIRAHPIVGVGPGCFKYNYMDYRIALASKYPPSWLRGEPVNYGEVHNDHLQVLSETGLPGYTLLLAGVLMVMRPQGFFRKRGGTASEANPLTRVLGRELRLPLAVVFVLLALAQFPLQLAAPRFVFLMLAALCLGWDDRDAS